LPPPPPIDCASMPYARSPRLVIAPELVTVTALTFPPPPPVPPMATLAA
jgi:hypothetical protein